MSKANPGSDSQIDLVFRANFSNVGKGVRPTQRTIIQSVLDGHNTLGLMPTGSGKSLCYWIAGKSLGGITLVVSPLTALMDEQAQKLEEHGCRVFTLHSGIDARVQQQELIDLYNARDTPDFIFLSPERLATDGFVEFVLHSKRDQIKLVVVDEAHCISQWGEDFRPFYKEIPYFLRAIFDLAALPAILCLTATLNPKNCQQICEDFGIEATHIVRHDMLLRPEINIQVIKVPDEDTKDERFWTLLEEHRAEKVLIYINRKYTKRSVETLCAEALERGFKAAFFHGDMTSAEKAEVIRRFKSGELLTVFATSAFGMGIDIPDIRGVIHYMLTESVEDYYQQIGRVGRDGKPAWAVLFYSDKNIQVYKSWAIDKSFPTEKDILKAFSNLTDNQTGKRPFTYFEESDETQSAYHYLVRSRVIAVVCKGMLSLEPLKPVKGTSFPPFDAYRSATRTGLLVLTAQNLKKPETEVLRDVYQWLAEGKITNSSSLTKCLVIDSAAGTLPADLLEAIKANIAEKKAYRNSVYDEFVSLLETYTNTFEFHQRIGEYLGIDKFSRQRIHQTLSGDLVRSKSEVIVANILYQSGIPFTYEAKLIAPDGSLRVPDFTVEWAGQTYYWEHLGMLDVKDYSREWEIKKRWYDEHFPGHLITTQESSTLSQEVKQKIASRFGVKPVDEPIS